MNSHTSLPAGETPPLLFSAMWRLMAACVLMLSVIGTARAALPTLSFDKLYASYGVLGLEFSDEVKTFLENASKCVALWPLRSKLNPNSLC
ncbi:MAG: hypothetical protein ACMZI0_03215 [Symbiopectobacterium sp.]|uniref:hypothetical protein n=1 Tax=Symbiopectobacterium sp. TaxID=2952789 RepID=UPI0039E94022